MADRKAPRPPPNRPARRESFPVSKLPPPPSPPAIVSDGMIQVGSIMQKCGVSEAEAQAIFQQLRRPPRMDVARAARSIQQLIATLRSEVK